MVDVVGRQPVLEALRSGKEINKLLIAKGQKPAALREIVALARQRGIVVLVQLSEVRYWELDDLLAASGDAAWAPFLILLDGIQDPHNLGAIIRSAEALGAHGVIIPKRRGAAVTEAVMKASAGAANYLPVCRVTNLAATIDTLKQARYWVVGADAAGAPCFKQDLTGPIALVIGGEGFGLSRLVREKCDFLSAIPMRGQINSLNASVAASLLMLEVVRQRKWANLDPR